MTITDDKIAQFAAHAAKRTETARRKRENFQPDPYADLPLARIFHDRCVEAGVPGRAHGLRKAGATIAANNGATSQQLMAIFGWDTLKEAERYTRNADQLRLAESGMPFLEGQKQHTVVSHRRGR